DDVTRTLMRPLERFVRWESSSAALLLGAAAGALIWANMSTSYVDFWGSHASIKVGPLHLDESLRHWVNDLLMAVFFFVVALEVKREMLFGSLRDRRAALVPAAAAFGTMIGAAAVYLAFNASGGDLRGWAIPIATDIAFALGVLGLVGRRAPKELRAFILTLAVVDDLATIVVIAVFFTEDLSFGWLGAAAGLLVVVALARRAGVRNLVVYVVLAAAVWLAVFESGVHATVAGVLLGFLTPAVALRNREKAAATITDDLIEIRQDDDREVSDAALLDAASDALGAVAPLTRVEEALHPYSAYLILPLFALANAGVPLSISGVGDALSSPVGLGIFFGLVVGAPAGGMLLAYLSVRPGPGRMPQNLDWAAIGGVAPLKGIGFTIAIFITTLAFDDRELENTATLAVLAASLTAALIGVGVLLTRHALLARSSRWDVDHALEPQTGESANP
ncbi:MAG: Na+/H+ antiporter NhaA, partial [Jatrophihabitans sp.]